MMVEKCHGDREKEEEEEEEEKMQEDMELETSVSLSRCEKGRNGKEVDMILINESRMRIGIE